jgi:uncharacterized protein (DUF2062 family)
MAFKWTIRRLNRSGFSRRKLRGGVLHRWLGDHIMAREVWFPTRESFARAWFIGMMITLIPFLPAQTLIACAIGLVLRANLPICFILQFLSSPATVVIHLPACYLVGCLILGNDVGQAFTQIKADPMSVVSLGSAGLLFVGALALGLVIGGLGYFLIKMTWKERVRKIRTAFKPLSSRGSESGLGGA